MLCPKCGKEIGDALDTCIDCRKQHEAAPEETSQEAENKNETTDTQESCVEAPQLIIKDESVLADVLSYFSTPLGIALSLLVMFLLVVAAVLAALPGEGILGSLILGILLAGLIAAVTAHVILLVELLMEDPTSGLISILIPPFLYKFSSTFLQHKRKVFALNIAGYLVAFFAFVFYPTIIGSFRSTQIRLEALISPEKANEELFQSIPPKLLRSPNQHFLF